MREGVGIMSVRMEKSYRRLELAEQFMHLGTKHDPERHTREFHAESIVLPNTF